VNRAPRTGPRLVAERKRERERERKETADTADTAETAAGASKKRRRRGHNRITEASEEAEDAEDAAAQQLIDRLPPIAPPTPTPLTTEMRTPATLYSKYNTVRGYISAIKAPFRPQAVQSGYQCR
jgi:hypothetical protein